MKLITLNQDESVGARGATHMAILTHADLTMATANTAQVIPLLTVANKVAVKCTHAVLKKAFEDVSDTAFDSTAITVGLGGAADQLLASMELNANTTEVYVKSGAEALYQFTEADAVDVTFGSHSGKSLVDIDAGEVHIYLQVVDARNVA